MEGLHEPPAGVIEYARFDHIEAGEGRRFNLHDAAS